ncbi:hypothetical protein F4803DRAFT_544662 [Xylaria telfairii]|nr:hypothetical protein F4803DRAFT_544662 [Xylaria telfairii]
MGVLYSRHQFARSNAGSNQSSGEDAVDPWLVVVIAAGILIIITLAGFMLAHYIRSRRRLGRGFFRHDGKATRGSFSRKRNSDAAADRQMAEDLERDMMIRKSLASRPTSYSNPDPQPLPNGDDHIEEEGQGREETPGLREDWKAWEARVQTERSMSHPGGVGLDRHPASASYLSIPQPTRLPSPHRGVGARRF